MRIEGDYNSLDTTFDQTSRIAHVSTPRDFFKMFPICESCLVKVMCLIINPQRIYITKPCERFEAHRKNPKIGRRN